jgi:hypothetical protein
MSESKTGARVRRELKEFAGPDQGRETASSRQRHSPAMLKPGREPAENANGKGGWDAYRRWLTRVQSPASGRAPLDASLYTWKGYRSWSDQVRRDWNNEE